MGGVYLAREELFSKVISRIWYCEENHGTGNGLRETRRGGRAIINVYIVLRISIVARTEARYAKLLVLNVKNSLLFKITYCWIHHTGTAGMMG